MSCVVGLTEPDGLSTNYKALHVVTSRCQSLPKYISINRTTQRLNKRTVEQLGIISLT